MRAALHLGILLAAVTLSHAVSAAPPASAAGEGGPAVAEAARARFNEGVALYGKKKYERAQAAFLQAHALTKNPAILINLGLTSSKLGRPLQAAGYLDRFLREAKDATPELRARAQKALAEARRSLGSVEVTAPEGAEIAVDGDPTGRAPLASPIDVMPGRHEVTITTASGMKSETVTVAVGTTAKVRVAAQGRIAPPNAVLEPSSGPSPGAPSGAPAAGPETASEASGFFAPPSTSWPVYAFGAVGLASFAAAVVLGGIGANADHNITNAQDALTRNGKSPDACADPASAGDPTIAATCSTLHSGQRASSDVKTPFVVTLAVGGGTTLFALGWYFFAPKAHATKDAAPPQAAAPRLMPLIGARGEPGASFDLAF